MSRDGAGEAAVPLPRAPVTHEDLERAHDRLRVYNARLRGRRWYLVWLLIGPGILAMLGENDGPSMISYTATGATYGLGTFLPFALLTFAMAIVCQEMCMRVGAVTHRGYGKLVLERFGPLWGWFAAGDLILTNLVTLVAEFVAIRVGLRYFHVGASVSAALGVLLVACTLSGGRYWRWERAVLALAAFNALFLIAALLTHPPVGTIGHALLTASPFPHGSLKTLLLLVASTIGATVTPWMIFFQQSASADKGMTPADVRHGRYDTVAGGLMAAAFGLGAMVAGAALFRHGGGNLNGLSGVGFPGALGRVSGDAVGTLFALGLVEAGAVAVLTISASTGYAVSECIGAPHSMNNSVRGATVFYGANLLAALIAAAVILIPGAPLLSISLNANVLATVLLPVSLVFLLMLANDRELMGPWVNRRRGNVLAVAIVLFVSVAGAAYAVVSFLQAVHLV